MQESEVDIMGLPIDDPNCDTKTADAYGNCIDPFKSKDQSGIPQICKRVLTPGTFTESVTLVKKSGTDRPEWLCSDGRIRPEEDLFRKSGVEFIKMDGTEQVNIIMKKDSKVHVKFKR